jgi:hypothetical protein
MGVGSDSELVAVLKDLFGASPTEAEARMLLGGSVLQSQIFAEETANRFGRD